MRSQYLLYQLEQQKPWMSEVASVLTLLTLFIWRFESLAAAKTLRFRKIAVNKEELSKGRVLMSALTLNIMHCILRNDYKFMCRPQHTEDATFSEDYLSTLELISFCYGPFLKNRVRIVKPVTANTSSKITVLWPVFVRATSGASEGSQIQSINLQKPQNCHMLHYSWFWVTLSIGKNTTTTTIFYLSEGEKNLF